MNTTDNLKYMLLLVRFMLILENNYKQGEQGTKKYYALLKAYKALEEGLQ
jgi:hypothetical protein